MFDAKTTCIVVVGAQWGDEGKGKLVDVLAERADLVVVYQHNHVFGITFGTIMAEELPERLVPPSWLKAWAKAEVDAGADIVVMHGAPSSRFRPIWRPR